MPAQWIIIDAKVYDVTKFKGLHPGGISVFFADDVGASSLLSDQLPFPHAPNSHIDNHGL